jgi:hypothetical protein
MPKQTVPVKSSPPAPLSARSDLEPRAHVVWHPNGGRPRIHDDTPRTARPAPSLPTKPFDWRAD